MADNFGLKIGLEGEKEFKNSLAEINQSFKVLGSEMKLVESQFDKNDKSVEALTARNDVLGKQIEAQKEKIQVLRAALKNAADSFGENDKRTQAWQIQLNNAEAALNGMERELKSNNAAIENSGEGMDDAGKATDKFGKEIDGAAKEADKATPIIRTTVPPIPANWLSIPLPTAQRMGTIKAAEALLEIKVESNQQIIPPPTKTNRTGHVLNGIAFTRASARPVLSIPRPKAKPPATIHNTAQSNC